MTVQTVLSIGHPTLRVVADEVPINDIPGPEIQGVIDDLIETMRHANGAGLAATQVDRRLRIAVMEVGHNPRYPYKPPIPLTVAIKPVIEPLDGVLFVDRVTDPSTLATWDQYETHHRDAFVKRITEFVKRVGS